MKKGQARGAPGLLFPVSAHHPLVGVGLFELPRCGAILAGRFMLAVRDYQLAQVPEDLVNLGRITWAGLNTELPTEVQHKRLGVSHPDIAVLLPEEDSPHHPGVVRHRCNPFVRVNNVSEHIVAGHPAISRLGHLSPSFRDEWVGLPLSFYSALYYKI